MKRGPLSKIERYYVESNRATLSVSDIARDLDRPVETVEKHLAAQTVAEATPAPKARSPILQQMTGKERRGIAIMTQAVSEASDDTRVANLPKRFTDGIAKIYDE